MRLFLFDVDGTLLTARGVGRAALKRALEQTFGTAGALAAYDLRGKTDPRIVWDVLTAAGTPHEEIEAHVQDVMGQSYPEELLKAAGEMNG